ncbi:MAG: NADH-quinone oxidoreductase subunit C [Nautiliaceae bacterium]|jgi:Ni,Fe-hydrogenase III component G
MIVNPNVQIEEVTLDNVVDKIKEFYDEREWNFITINATDLGGELQIDWLFSKYRVKNIIKIFRVEDVSYDAFIPSIVPIIPSAWLAEWELADLFGLDVENAATGVFIAPDGPKAPLRADTKL